MRIVLFLTVVLFSVITTNFARAAEDCPLQRIAVIPFETDETGHIFLPVIMGGKKVRLMVDTGAFWSGISKKLADQLGLQSKRSSFGYQMRDAAGKLIDRYVSIPSFQVGPIQIDDPMDFMILNEGSDDDDDVGILGMNFFAYMDLEIDNARRQIALFNQKHCRGAGVHWTDKSVTLTIIPDPQSPYPQPLVWAELQGEKIRVLLDTGATFSHIDIDRAKRRYDIKDSDLKRYGTSITATGQRIDTYLYTFKALTVSGITFENVTVLLGKFDGSEMLLGMNELKTLHLYIAPKDEMVHVTDAFAQ
jgi:clan AA aspartic protease (TIGR02281 family)